VRQYPTPTNPDPNDRQENFVGLIRYTLVATRDDGHILYAADSVRKYGRRSGSELLGRHYNSAKRADTISRRKVPHTNREGYPPLTRVLNTATNIIEKRKPRASANGKQLH